MTHPIVVSSSVISLTLLSLILDQFIMQEYDKLDRVVPAWKVKWCKENLHHMIGKDDNE